MIKLSLLKSKQGFSLTIASWLTYLGTLPFWYGILMAFDIAPLSSQLDFDLEQALLAYAAIILSFIAGIHWGIALSSLKQPGSLNSPTRLIEIKLLISSNVVALWGWLMLFALDKDQAWWGLCLGFVTLLMIDKFWIGLEKNSPWFWQLRLQATSTAILCMLLSGIM